MSAHNRELLPNNKRLREDTLSETSGAYSDARTRLKLETVEFFANRVCDSLIKASPPEIGAMYGEDNTSEGKLAKLMAKPAAAGHADRSRWRMPTMEFLAWLTRWSAKDTAFYFG